MVSQSIPSLSSFTNFFGYDIGPSVALNSTSAGKHDTLSSNDVTLASQHAAGNTKPGSNVDLKEKAVSAAGAAFLSAVIVNPLDVAKTRLQAQAAGVHYQNQHISEAANQQKVIPEVKCPPVCPRGGPAETVPLCPPDCFRYKGTLDVFYKVIRQEGISRLWRGTDAALAIAVPTVGIYLPCYDVLREWLEDLSSKKSLHLEPYAPFLAGTMARSLACVTCAPIELARTRMQAHKEVRQGVTPPGIWATLSGTISVGSRGPLQRVRVLWTGVGAQLARDVPFSAICWSTLEPTRRKFLQGLGSEANAAGILAANFGAGVIAGCIAAAVTCPLDVVKTRRQIVKDPSKAVDSSSAKVLLRVWRDEGLQGLFTGAGPRVARAGPSVGIVVSFYEVMKYFIHHASHEK